MKRLLWSAIGLLMVCNASAASAADYAPLDCTKAKSAAETTICKTYSLGQAEARMATLYGVATALVPMGQRGDLGDTQSQWIERREACGSNVACLTEAYNGRIEQLSKVIAGIASRGPY